MKKSKPTCNSCGADRFAPVIDLGSIPIAHRFLKAPATQAEYRHRMAIHLCENCALIQILEPVPPEELYRDYNFCFTAWKPQPHMQDEIARMRSRLSPGDAIVELGSNDGFFLAQLKTAGFTNLAGVEPNRVANEQARRTGAAIYEGFFNPALAEKVLDERGPAALIVSRQAVEHISDLRGLASGIRRLLMPNGWLLLEVPDFDVPLRYGDISALWEEHVNYFTENTLRGFLAQEGFDIVEVERYPFSGGALMVLARMMKPAEASARSKEMADARRDAARFPDLVAAFRSKLTGRLESNRESDRSNSLYGTGCRANMLLNAFGLEPFLDCVVDDQPEKQGLYMPGSSLKIEPSSALLRNGPGDCFMSVNAENENKVIERNDSFVKRGGRFISLNSPSPKLLEIEAAAS